MTATTSTYLQVPTFANVMRRSCLHNDAATMMGQADARALARQAWRSAQRSAAAEMARGVISTWKRPEEDWGDSGTPLSLDLWTRVLEHLCNDIEPKGVRSVSVIARDLCNAGMTCKELYVSSGQAFHRLASLCPPIELEAEWAACLQGPMALKLPELKALAPSAGLQKSLPKPTLAVRLLQAWNLQCPTQAPPRVLMEVARERKLSLNQLNLSHLIDGCLNIPELREARALSVFHARQACTKLGFTSLPLLNTATHEVKRLRQEQDAALREAWARTRKAREQAARTQLEAQRAAFQAGSAVERRKCLHCRSNTAAVHCPFTRCGACCHDASCKYHHGR